MNTKNKVYFELENLLNLESGSIKGGEFLVDLQWDSMASVMFIAMADEMFGIPIDANVLKEVKTVDDLLQMLPLDSNQQ